MEHSETSRKNIESIDNLAIQLVLDDFGTGYSSLQQLVTLPIKGLKIDRTFVQMSEESDHAKKILEMSIDLGKGLNKHIIAEGTETRKQVKILEAQDCPHVQGFYFHKPMPAYDFRALLHQDNK